jgi:hypothetical protein
MSGESIHLLENALIKAIVQFSGAKKQANNSLALLA